MVCPGTDKKLQMEPECKEGRNAGLEGSKEASVNVNLNFVSHDPRPWTQGRLFCHFQETVNCHSLDVMC